MPYVRLRTGSAPAPARSHFVAASRRPPRTAFVVADGVCLHGPHCTWVAPAPRRTRALRSSPLAGHHEHLRGGPQGLLARTTLVVRAARCRMCRARAAAAARATQEPSQWRAEDLREGGSCQHAFSVGTRSARNGPKSGGTATARSLVCRPSCSGVCAQHGSLAQIARPRAAQ